jgi:hypothetical protein
MSHKYLKKKSIRETGPKKCCGTETKYVLGKTNNREMRNECGMGDMKYSEGTKTNPIQNGLGLNLGLSSKNFVHIT